MSAKKEGGCLRKDGYILITHDRKRKYLHRHIMEQLLGRTLTFDETIHHKDGNRSNNDPLNLELLSRSEHTRRFPKKVRLNQNDYKFCMGCGKKFYRKDKKGKFSRAKFCNHLCLMANAKRGYHGYLITN